MLRRLGDVRGFALPTLIMLIAGVLGGAFSYIFQIMTGRLLGPALYSELAALISIFTILSIFTSILSLAISRYISKYKARDLKRESSWLIRRMMFLGLILGVVISLVLLVLTPILKDYLQIESDLALFLLDMGVIFALLAPVGSGSCQGLQRFVVLGTANLSAPLTKLIVGVSLVWLGYEVAGAMAGVIFAPVISMLVCYTGIRDLLFDPGQKGDVSGMFRYLIPVAIGSLCFLLLTNVDIVLAKAFLPDVESGIYSAASILSKVILFLPTAVVAVMFPKVSEAHEVKGEIRATMNKSILTVMGLCLLVNIVVMLFPSEIINILYGNEYVGAENTLIIMSWAMTFLSLSNLFMNYGLATDDYPYIFIMAFFTMLEIGLIILYHSSMEAIASSVLVSSLGIVSFNFYYHMIKSRKSRPARSN